MRPTSRRRTTRGVGAALLGSLALIGCGGGGSAGPTSAPPPPPPAASPSAAVTLTAANFDAVVTNGEGVCLVDFFHPNCGHCQAMEPIVERLATDFEGRAVVGKLNVATEPGIANAWDIRGYPTFVLVKNGRELSRRLGGAGYDQLAEMVQSALDAA